MAQLLFWVVLLLLSLNGMTKSNLEKEWLISFFRFQFIIEGSQGKNSRQKPWRNAPAYWLSLRPAGTFLIQPKPTCLEMVPPIVG